MLSQAVTLLVIKSFIIVIKIGDYYSIIFRLRLHVLEVQRELPCYLCYHVGECQHDISSLLYPPGYPGGRATLLSTTAAAVESFEEQLLLEFRS